MTPYLIYALEVQCDGLQVEVRLNDVRVFREPLGGKRFTAKKLNPWLVDGSNVVQVRAARLGAAPPYLTVAIAHGPGGPELPKDEDHDLRYAWNADDQPLEDELTLVADQRFDLGEAHGSWSWQSAPVYQDADRPGLESAVTELHALLGGRDAQRYADRMQVKIAEMSRALSVPVAELEADLRAWLAELFAQHDWQMAPLDPTSLRFEPAGQGRLVVVTDANGGPPLRGGGNESAFETPELTFSRLDRGWTVVR